MDNLVTELGRQVGVEVDELGAASANLDIYFLAYLRRLSRFGYFSFGPIHIDVGVIEDIVRRTTPLAEPGTKGSHGWSEEFDFVDYSRRLMAEVQRSGRRRIDELHYLLT